MSSESPPTVLPPFPGSKRRQKQKRPVKAPLTIDRIVDAAFDVMARDGYEAITMRRLALELGTGPASLYAHINSKRDLDALIVDRAATEITVPDPDPAHWDQQIIQVMRDLRAAMLRHPGVARAVIGYIPTGPQALLTSDRLVAIMMAGGVNEQVAAWSCDLLPLYVTAVAFEDSLFSKLDDGTSASPEEFVLQLRAYYESLPADRFPHLVASAVALTTGDGEERFEFGLQVLLAGITAVSKSWPDVQPAPAG